VEIHSPAHVVQAEHRKGKGHSFGNHICFHIHIHVRIQADSVASVFLYAVRVSYVQAFFRQTIHNIVCHRLRWTEWQLSGATGSHHIKRNVSRFVANILQKKTALPYTLLAAAILDNSEVSVKPSFPQGFSVPGIGHYEAVRKKVVRLLRESREGRRLSNNDVAQRCGVSESMLSLVERDLRNPTMELTLRMVDGIGVSLPVLIRKAMLNVDRKERALSLDRKFQSHPAE
jgi:DNA-binding XRE family transcriptional regulator